MTTDINADDFINWATAIAKAHADRVAAAAAAADPVTDADRLRWARRSLDRQDAKIEELTAVLQLFVKQWNACGPNSEFGKYFSNVRNAAVAILQRDKSPEPMHVWSND